MMNRFETLTGGKVEKQRQSERHSSMEVLVFASPAYWSCCRERLSFFDALTAMLGLGDCTRWQVSLIDSNEDAYAAEKNANSAACIVVPLSDGVQAWMESVTESKRHVALWNVYLMDTVQEIVRAKLIDARAHVGCCEYFAMRRLSRKPVQWFSTLTKMVDYVDAWQGVEQLKNARFLRLNLSNESNDREERLLSDIAARLGCRFESITIDEFHDVYRNITEVESEDEARLLAEQFEDLSTIDASFVIEASREILAVRQLLCLHGADCLSVSSSSSVGCLGGIDHLALHVLGHEHKGVYAGVGDIDLTLCHYLVRILGGDFTWTGNPIVHGYGQIDFTDSLSVSYPRSISQQYQLMYRHESERCWAPGEATAGPTVSAVQLNWAAQKMVCHVGRTERLAKVPVERSQIRLFVESSDEVLGTLLSSSFLMCYGDFGKRLEYTARFLEIDYRHTENLP